MILNHIAQAFRSGKALRDNIADHRSRVVDSGVTASSSVIKAFKEELHDTTAGVFEGGAAAGIVGILALLVSFYARKA